jgi:hypothetical protein
LLRREVIANQTPHHSNPLFFIHSLEKMFGRRFASQFGRRATGSRRNMGGHAEVPTEGLDGFVRKYLPKDEHVRKGNFSCDVV